MKLLWMKVGDAIVDSFWFLPVLMAALAAAAALGGVTLDQWLGDDWVPDIGWVWAGGAEGARSMLSTIAGSAMTVVSIVFSLTISTLAQVSSRYGPRVLRNFTSDRGNQFVLGTFIATFIYCLLVLRTVRSVEESHFVPTLSVNVGVGLAVASLLVLIYFIHHISQGIQAEHLVAQVAGEFQKAVPRLFPEPIGSARGDQDAPDPAQWEAARAVDAADDGYLQRIDDDRLMRLAVENDLELKLEKRPGEFVIRAAALVRALPPSRITGSLERELRECFSLGVHRTPDQDALFSIQQLVEIAAHAMSPGINEPFTALTCIDWLGASLRSVADRRMPSPLRHDDSGRLRVVARPLTFAELANAAFDPLRLYGGDNADLMTRMLDTFAELAPRLPPEDRALLGRLARLIGQDAGRIPNEADRQRLADVLQRTLRSLLADAGSERSTP